MGIMADVRVNTTQRMIIYRDFLVQETTDGWEWAHENHLLARHANGLCDTPFKCIEAIAAWHDLTIPGKRP
jgi:hypothetical protein